MDATSHNWTTAPAGSTIRVDLGTRRFSRGEKVLSWSAAPTDVRFVTTDGRRRLEAKADGLYAYSGFMLILR